MVGASTVELPRCASCASTQQENRRLRTTVEQLEKDNERLVKQHELDQAELSRLKDLLEKTRRAGKRQAAPFSKGPAKKQPRRPGRKRGEKYGPKAHRQPPERVDETFEAPLPKSCPECDGEVEEQRVAVQYQADLPSVIEPWVSQFNVHVGSCVQCGHRLQGRHPLQTSDALGAAAAQVGPRALALVAELKLATGMSYAKLSHLLDKTFNISITPSGLCLALQRIGRCVEPTYEALKQALRKAPWVSPDETGWRVGAASAWLWVYVTTWVTFYAVEIGRGFQEAAKVLGEDYRGKMIRDGWAAYQCFLQALHQSCLHHLLRRCHDNLETALGGTARFPHAVKRLLQKALELRDRRDAGKISAHGLAVATGRLKAAMKRLLAGRPAEEENRKFAKHLRKEQTALFAFLQHPELPATNHLAEQALRPIIATRKNCGGGHRTWKGANTFARIATVFRTALQQGIDPQLIFVSLLRCPKPTVAEHLLHEDDPANPARPPPIPSI